ncbi:Abi family protein [Actinomyces bowdenii]|uniref:Abi family protein n=1 Tax=Actinomyces bowdenii TaxID=131109 RepID=A0A853ENK0_9ACTO|nr:Abi family protein [Actinomyces bowdenii]MBF0698363.1 Abi family protein [Actinomyces bowdenii]MCR2053454.1 Abi family protein [Actinomyces bowdenii]NYS70535.1 Abi family protein [Actinomyces bowdenii]
MASRPLKPAMPVAQQIALLRERGMAIDEGLARQWFANVSYYRLSAYWHPARRLNGRGERSDTFIDGTTFSDVAALYEADRKLRTLMHDGMERIEITMRTRIAELLCIDDVLAYTDPGRFRNTFKHTE